jgi:hypothetical protein
MTKFFRKIIPLLGLIILICFVYRQFFFKGKIPVPADLMTGVYYPWLDYNWGYSTGVPVINPSISDVFSQFYPWKYLIVELFKKGVIPLWNQYSFSGTPLLEDYHTGVFFPFNIILFLPKNLGWGLYIFGQTLFAAIGMFLFLKHYIKNHFAQISGALIFSLSGLMTTWAEFGTGVWAAAMLPWIFYFLNKFLEKQKFRNLFFLSFFYASLILAGHAQLTLYSSLLIGFYLIYLLFIKREIKFKYFLPIIIFVILGIGLSAIALIPAYNQVSLSIRPFEKSYIKDLNNGLTPWYDLIRLYVPDFFGNPSTYNYWGDISYYENSPFLATLALPFLLPFFLKRFRKKQTFFWLIIFLSTIFLATANPLTSFFYNLKLPFLTYSSASRIFFLSSFSASILVAIGMEFLFENRHYKKAVIFSSVFLILVVIATLLKLKIGNINFNISFRNSIIPVGLLFILIVLLLSKIPKKIILFFLMVLIFFDLTRYFNKFNPFVDQKLVFPQTPTTEFLEKQSGIFRIGRLNREVMTPNSWIPYHLSSIEGYDPLALVDYSRFFNRTNNNAYTDSVSRFAEIFNPDFKFLDALNVKYLLSVENDKQKINPAIKLNNLKEVFRDKSTVIYQNPNYKERFYFISQVITVPNSSEMANLIDKNDFDPTNNAIIIDQNIKSKDFNIGNITVNSYQANSINLTTNNSGDGFLVIADSFNPGWNAYIDNNPTSIFEVNGALRGIQIPKGKHQIKMSYWPKSFDIGLKTSIICLSILLFSFFYFIHKKTW